MPFRKWSRAHQIKLDSTLFFFARPLLLLSLPSNNIRIFDQFLHISYPFCKRFIYMYYLSIGSHSSRYNSECIHLFQLWRFMRCWHNVCTGHPHLFRVPKCVAQSIVCIINVCISKCECAAHSFGNKSIDLQLPKVWIQTMDCVIFHH